MESGVTVPRAYVLWRGAGPSLVRDALAALSITPLSCAIISRLDDSPLAHEFSDTVVRTASDEDAIEFSLLAFQSTQIPSLVIANVEGVFAIYEDRRMEVLNWQVLDSTIN